MNNEAVDPITKKALAISKTLETLKPHYTDGELIVGLSTEKEKCHPIHPEIESTWIMEEGGLSAMRYRQYCPYECSEEDAKEFEDSIYPYWKDRTVTAKYRASCPDEILNTINGTGFGEPSFALTVVGSHITPNWPDILKNGTNSYVKIAKQKLEELDPNELENMEKILFYKSVIKVFNSVEVFARNWGKHLRELSAEEKNKEKKEELLELAKICERVPMEPARSFHEALQAIWFIFCVLTNDGTGPLYYFGRPDVYLWPYYSKDIEDGTLTKERAMELIECLYIKSNNTVFFIDLGTAQFFAGNSVFQNLQVGGTDRLGNNLFNDLSYMLIDAHIELRLVQPAMVTRLSDNTPEKFRNKVLDLVAAGMGYPSIYNDKVCKETMRNIGFDQYEANDYFCGGCMEVQKPAHWWWSPGQMINNAMAVDLAFTNGVKRKEVGVGNLCGEQISVQTGDVTKFQTYKEFEDAVKAHVKRQIDYIHVSAQHIVKAYHAYPLIINSCVQESCLERGLSFFEGGLYSSACPGYITHGIPDIGNSLAAVKKLVFDEKKISMEELKNALDADFEGYEEIRQMCLAAPKFGNDDDYVDMILQEFYDWIALEMKSKPGILSKYDPDQSTAKTRHQRGLALAPLSGALAQGSMVGALPSGRKLGDYLGDSCAAYPGTDVSGPTASLKSVGKIDYGSLHGVITNLYLNRDSVDTIEGRRRTNDLIRAAFDEGVGELQINVIDKDVYLDAQKHPENYPSLLVRVTGYSAYFVDLNKEVQDYILDRTQHAS